MNALRYVAAVAAVSPVAFAGVEDIRSVTSNGGNAVSVGPGTVRGWEFCPSACPGSFTLHAASAFDGGALGAWVDTGNLSKPDNNNRVLASTPRIVGPHANAWGEGEIELTGNLGLGIYRYSYTMNAWANAATPTAANPIHSTRTKAKYADPVYLSIGDVDTSMSFGQFLDAGSQFQAAVDGEDPLELRIGGRFGWGEAFEGEASPDMLWPLELSLPEHVIDLYEIRISEDILGGINAEVSVTDTIFEGFGIEVDRFAPDLEEVIESAEWSLSDGAWTLMEDLDLLTVTITSLDGDNFGEAAVVGASMESDAYAGSAVPGAPTVLTLAGFALLSGRTRRA